MNFKIIFIVILLIIFIGGGTYFFLAREKSIINTPSSTKSAVQQSTEKYDNQYYSFAYDSNQWTLEESRLFPAQESSITLKSIEKNEDGVMSKYILTFIVYDPDEYIKNDTDSAKCLPGSEVCQEKLNQRKELIPVNKNNFEDFINMNFFLTDDETMYHREFFSLSGKNCAIELGGNQNIFYGGSMYCYTQNKVVKIQVRDLSQSPIRQLATEKNNLLNLMSNKFYWDIINSTVIN